MKRISALVVTLGIAVASFSSCSRSNYVFNTTAPAYLGSEKVQAKAPATPTVAATAPEATPTEVIPAQQAATVVLHRPASVPAATGQKVTEPVAAAATPEVVTDEVSSTIAKPTLSRVERKEMRHQLKQVIASHKSTTAGGKSQLVAALLCFFLGGLGIHRFYLGYTLLGVVYIVLALTSFLIVPGIVLLLLVLIDFIRILIGSLKPKGGEYAKPL